MPDSVRTPRRLLAICSGLVALYLAVLSGQRAIDGYRARQEVASVVREIEALRGENTTLQSRLADALGDDEIERRARSELGLVKPGDRAVVLTRPDGESATARPRPGLERGPPTWRQWLALFFDPS